MPATMFLNPSTWDWDIDASGNIAKADEPYALAQDAASAIRTFQGECWYDSTVGVPYWSLILGKQPPLSLVKAQFVAAALTVPNVATAVCYLNAIVNRNLVGQVQITDVSGNVSVATI